MTGPERDDGLLEDLTCIRCLREWPIEDLDRLLWCTECLARARRRAIVRGWTAGGVLALVLTLYVGLWIQPDFSLIPTAWVLMLAAAFYLGARVARESLFGWDRIRNRGAVEASPPAADFEIDDETQESQGWE